VSARAFISDVLVAREVLALGFVTKEPPDAIRTAGLASRACTGVRGTCSDLTGTCALSAAGPARRTLAASGKEAFASVGTSSAFANQRAVLARGLDDPQTSAAAAYAERKHAGQHRSVGTPFVQHPLEVATLLYYAGAPDHVIAAGLLHDVIEKAGVSPSGPHPSTCYLQPGRVVAPAVAWALAGGATSRLRGLYSELARSSGIIVMVPPEYGIIGSVAPIPVGRWTTS
jgi:hypothetical protein